MKKMLAALLVLLLCLQCVPTLASDAVQYTDPKGEFSVTVPSGWLCLDQSNTQNYINAMVNGEFSFPGFDVTTLSNLKAQLDVIGGGTYFFYSDNSSVFIRSMDLGVQVTEEQFVANLLPQIMESEKNMLPDIQYENAGTIVTYGNNRFVSTLSYYTLYGVWCTTDTLYHLNGTKMFEITITIDGYADESEEMPFYAGALSIVESFAAHGTAEPAQPSGGLGKHISFSEMYGNSAENTDSTAEIPSVAETEATQPEQIAAYKTYTHPTQGFSIIVPAEWIAVDRTNIQSRIDAAAAGQISVPNVNMHRLMTNMQAQIEANDMAVFVDGNANCMTVTLTNFGQVITYDQYEEQVLPMVMSSYAAKAGYREIIGGERVVYGGKEFIIIEVEFGTGNSRAHTLQLAYIDGADLYAITTNTLSLYDQTVIDAFNTAVLEAAATIVSVK